MPYRLVVSLLNNDVRNKCNDCEGVYLLHSSRINGKSHWRQKDGSLAIWYDPLWSNWKMGKDLGSSVGIFLTDAKLTGAALPHETKWKYKIGGKWRFSDSISVSTCLQC